jgi:hypothetical protein
MVVVVLKDVVLTLPVSATPPVAVVVVMVGVPSAASVVACAAACARLTGGLSDASMTDTDRLEGLLGWNRYTD